MAVNKVIYRGSTLIDITGTTATAEDVIQGKTFYNAAGVSTSGTRPPSTTIPVDPSPVPTTVGSIYAITQ